MSDSFAELDAALRQFDGHAALAACDALRATDAGDDPCAMAGRVRALWLLRRWDEARAQLAHLDEWRNSVHVELARGIVALGQPDDPLFPALNCGAALRNVDRALAAFRAASELEPANAEALAGQATALRMSGQVDEALQLIAGADSPLQKSSAVRVERALCLAECDATGTALGSAELALERDPGDLRAAIVRIELLRLDRQTAAAARAAAEDLRLRFPRNAGVLEILGWTLVDQALKEKNLEFHKAAVFLFQESLQIESGRPGAVLGAVTGLLAHGRFAAARELAETAARRDPLSPQLISCHADVLVAENAPPPKIIEAYQRVLDADPRMFWTRLHLARTLLDVNRRSEAREVVAVFKRYYPHHSQAARASLWLQTPWRMPASSAIERRIQHPWEEGRDHPEHVLEHLIGEVGRKWQLPQTAVDRLRDRVELNRNGVLEQAFSYEQNYLNARDNYQNAARRGPKSAAWRLLGYLFSVVSGAAVVQAMPWLILLIAQTAGLSGYWQWTLAISIPLFLVSLALDVALSAHVRILRFEPIELVAFLFALSLPAAAIWHSVLLYGTARGILIGLIVFAVVAFLYKAGQTLVGHFKVEESLAQAAFDRWLEYLYGTSLLPLAAEVGGELTSPYATVLPSTSKIVSEAVVDIDTQATKELRQLLRQRSKGSFALAGPRGAGKSTLLERWCAGQLLRETGTGAQQARMDLSVRVDAPVGYQSKDFLTHLFGRLCDEVEKYAVDHDLAINDRVTRTSDGSARSVLSVLLRMFRLSLGTRAERERRPSQGIMTASELLHRARSERSKLRFLQSHTTEGELSLGAPPLSGGAIGFKRKTSVKRDDIPLNHPQLVDRFRAFLGVAAEVVRNLNGKVLVGIDELDRISDGEGAQQFLNELKAVFNVPNCYFLVSVSEDALADFELSAMGMRTVFDSAFDTIVRVDYLTFDQAKLLLNRRVADLPEQFAALAYVVSGGLARELIRLSEAISDHRPSEKLELAAVSARLVRRQLGRTARAAMDRLSRSPDRGAGATLIAVLDEYPVDELTGDLLRNFAAKIAATETDDEPPGFVAGIRLDVAVMAEYLAVLLDVFDNRLDEQGMAVGVVRGPGGFETLTRARRYLGANPHGARELVIAFRKAWDQHAMSAAG
ncbi:hypothetical protein ACWEGE_42170 [Amycolatopsis sp. NPDC004747]